MKKLFLILTCIIVAVGATSCSSSAATPTKSGSYWLSDYKTMTVGTVHEISEYSVTVKAEKNAKVAVSEGAQGTYTTVLTSDVYNETPCYKLVSQLTFSGEYVYGSTRKLIDDAVTSTVYFLGADKNIKPLHVEKTVQSTSPVAKVDGKIEFKDIRYNYTVEYGKKATVTFNETTDVLNLDQSFEHKFSAKGFCENELLFMYPRMFNLASNGYVSSLKTFSVLSNAIQTVSCSLESTKKQKAVAQFNYYIPGVIDASYDSVTVDCLSICLSGTNSGPKIYGYYTTYSNSFNKVILVGLETPVYSVGSLVYELTSFSSIG